MPTSALERVLIHKAQSETSGTHQTKRQKWILGSAIASLIVSFVLAAISVILKVSGLALAAILLLLLSSLLTGVNSIAIMIPEFKKLKNVRREISNPLIVEFDRDIELISELTRDFELHHLSYAHASFSLMAEQLKTRISVVVGAIEKVGVIPLGIAAYIAWKDFAQKHEEALGGSGWMLAALICVYLYALEMFKTAQWADRVTLLLKEACEVRRSARGNDIDVGCGPAPDSDMNRPG